MLENKNMAIIIILSVLVWLVLGLAATLYSVRFSLENPRKRPLLFLTLCCFGPVLFLLILLDDLVGRE